MQSLPLQLVFPGLNFASQKTGVMSTYTFLGWVGGAKIYDSLTKEIKKLHGRQNGTSVSLCRMSWRLL